jgi:transcriptional regulator with XRE-family HTH domain
LPQHKKRLIGQAKAMSDWLMEPVPRFSNPSAPTSIGNRIVTAPLLATFLLLGPFGTSSTLSVSADISVVHPDAVTGIGGFPAGTHIGADRTDLSATAEAIRHLRAQSGLTWDELARCFGVSRRTIHAWANGSRLNQSHAQHLSVVARIVEALKAETPDKTRAALHAPGSDGISSYQRLIQSLAQSGNRREGFTPTELLAVGEMSDAATSSSDEEV